MGVAQMLQYRAQSQGSDLRVSLERYEHFFEALESVCADDGARFLRLESSRESLLGTLNALLLPHAEPGFPLHPDDLRLAQRGVGVFEQLRDQYLLVQELRRPNRVPGRRLLPRETCNTVQDVLPLIRALDAQARLVRLLLRKRLDVPPNYWRELLTLGGRARASTFIDTAIQDVVPMLKRNSARALLVLPLLLRTAHLAGHDAHDRIMIDRLARQWAASVGFRIDLGGQVHTNRYGPTIAIDERMSIRLDTHRLRAWLANKVDELHHGVPFGQSLPRGITLDGLRRLVSFLLHCWGVEPSPARPSPIEATECSVHFGVPGVFGAEFADDVKDELRPNVRRQYEFNTLMRIIRPPSAGRAATPLWLAQSAPLVCDAWCVSQGFIEASVVRKELQTIHHHGLVVLRPDRRQRAPQLHLSDPASLWLGRLVAMTQHFDDSLGSNGGQRLSIQLWPIPGRMAGLRFQIEGPFEDILYLPGAAGSADEHSVLLTPGRVSSKAALTLRLPNRDIDVRFGNIIERGYQFERVRLLAEPIAF